MILLYYIEKNYSESIRENSLEYDLQRFLFLIDRHCSSVLHFCDFKWGYLIMRNVWDFSIFVKPDFVFRNRNISSLVFEHVNVTKLSEILT